MSNELNESINVELITTSFVGLGLYGYELGKSLSKNWKADYPLSIYIHKMSNEISCIETLLRNKDLIFIGCDSVGQASILANSIQRLSSPFLVLILCPHEQKAVQQSSPLKNSGYILAPLVQDFPAAWDPVSTILGSLVST